MVLGRKHKPPDKPPEKPANPSPPPPAVSPPPIANAAVSANSPYRELGNTTRDAFKQAMLRTVGGAVPFVAELDAMYDALAAKGVTRLAVPMSWMECKNSTYPTCGVPTRAKNPWSVTGGGDAGSSGRWAAYSSYAAAAKEWARLITIGGPYIGDTTIAQFIHTYAPASDNNDEATYINTIVNGVNALPLSDSGITPAPPPPAPIDPIRVIVGGDYPPITYGFLSDVGINSYAYVVGHGGTRSTQHSGVDVPVPHGTKLYTPLAGTVTCVGDAGQVIWGEGCGAFHDDMYGGIGNITIKFDGFDLKMTLGHCHTCVVALGSHVVSGQQVGTSGGSNGDHCHIDLATIKNGSYWLLDARGPELAAAMGGVAPVMYADPVDVPQPDDDPPYVIVRAVRTTPVLQRANPAAPPIFEPLTAGTTFHAQERVIGADGRWYWVGRLRGRVAEADTEVVEVVTA